VTADHGEAFFEHGHWEHTETLFEEIVHVPLIVKWPRSLGIAGGQRVREPVGQIDIYATVLEAAGVAAPTPEARSLLHTLHVRGGDRVIVSEVAWHRPDHTVLQVALRGHRYKYIARLEGPAEPEFQLELRGEQLYDLESDPAERHDRIADPPVDLGLLRGRLKEYLGRAHDVSHARRGDRIELDAATLRRLRALGYVQ
jgi:arylsulfatase A-like enzyme